MTEQNQNKNNPGNNLGTKIQGRDLYNKSAIIYEFQSVVEASRNLSTILHVKPKTIQNNIFDCLNGNQKSYKGITWKYSTIQYLNNEIWKSIPQEIIQCEENWKVSTKGRIQTNNNIITYGHKNANGYMNIQINGKEFLIHRLVAHVHIYNDDKENKTVINHKNEQKDNNTVENLEWSTPSQNTNYSNGNRFRRIQCTYKNKTIVFPSLDDAANWIIENNIRTKSSTDRISESCRSEFIEAYGIKFWYIILK